MSIQIWLFRLVRGVLLTDALIYLLRRETGSRHVFSSRFDLQTAPDSLRVTRMPPSSNHPRVPVVCLPGHTLGAASEQTQFDRIAVWIRPYNQTRFTGIPLLEMRVE